MAVWEASVGLLTSKYGHRRAIELGRERGDGGQEPGCMVWCGVCIEERRGTREMWCSVVWCG